jgi:hypothetical protein
MFNMPCDKFMEQSLEERLDSAEVIPIEQNNLAYLIRTNPETGYVQYQFPGNPKWIDSD